MGYQWPFKFQLRDDQIVFGNLTCDKEAATVMSNAILNYKRLKDKMKISDSATPSQVAERVYNNTQYDSMLKSCIDTIVECFDWCYENEELKRIKEDKDVLIKDIDTMTKYVQSKQGLSAWFSSMTVRFKASAEYIVGSQSFIRSYTDYKNLAAELLYQIEANGIQTRPEELTDWQQKYGDIVKTTTRDQRIADTLDQQFYEDMQNGELSFDECVAKRNTAAEQCGVRKLNSQLYDLMRNMAKDIAVAKADQMADETVNDISDDANDLDSITEAEYDVDTLMKINLDKLCQAVNANTSEELQRASLELDESFKPLCDAMNIKVSYDGPEDLAPLGVYIEAVQLAWNRDTATRGLISVSIPDYVHMSVNDWNLIKPFCGS